MIYDKDYMRAQHSGYTFHFFIHGEVGCSSNYIDLLDALYNGTEADTIYIHINTMGGYLDTAIELIQAMSTTPAHVITCADGLVASAGSLLFFSGHAFVVGKFCEVMLHDGSGGPYGKFNENKKSIDSSSKRLELLYHSVYEPFFTKKEVAKVLKGEDLYLLSEEVEERILKTMEVQEQEDGDIKDTVKKGEIV